MSSSPNGVQQYGKDEISKPYKQDDLYEFKLA